MSNFECLLFSPAVRSWKNQTKYIFDTSMDIRLEFLQPANLYVFDLKIGNVEFRRGHFWRKRNDKLLLILPKCPQCRNYKNTGIYANQSDSFLFLKSWFLTIQNLKSEFWIWNLHFAISWNTEHLKVWNYSNFLRFEHIIV